MTATESVVPTTPAVQTTQTQAPSRTHYYMPPSVDVFPPEMDPPPLPDGFTKLEFSASITANHSADNASKTRVAADLARHLEHAVEWSATCYREYEDGTEAAACYWRRRDGKWSEWEVV